MKLLIGHLITILFIGQVFGQKTDRVRLVESNQSACDQTSDAYRIKARIVSLEHLNDTLAIEIGFAATCCLEYIPNIKYTADTLYISYSTKGNACSCICCYSFSHKLKGVKSSKLTVKLYSEIIELSTEKYRTYSPTYTLIKGDTINLKDKYGLKQGIWTTAGSSFMKYEDDIISQWGHIYNDLKIKDEYDTKTKIFREFHANGKISKECYKTDDGNLIDCRQWRLNGDEIIRSANNE